MNDIQSRSIRVVIKLTLISLLTGGLIALLRAWPELWVFIGIAGAYWMVRVLLSEVQAMIDESRAEEDVPV